MKKLIIASKNKGKILEFRQLFSKYGIEITSLFDLENEPPDVEETGKTFYENARLKAEKIAEIVNMPVLADDSGLQIDALDGRPGVYSARYAGEPTNDIQNYEKVLNEMNDVRLEERSARFICVLALARPGKETLYKEGLCEGSIATEPKGTNGFGYDPIFIPKGFTGTMAELENDEKNKISHRYHALLQLENWLNEQQNSGE